MAVRFAHTSITARDWKSLAAFYQKVFGCIVKPPQRNQSGEWLEQGTGVKNAALQGVHLLLPGHGENAPTLEIYSYTDPIENDSKMPNKVGYSHIAFEVEDVEATKDLVLEHGGCNLGQITKQKIPGAGEITFVYMKDPEGNVIELQSWY